MKTRGIHGQNPQVSGTVIDRGRSAPHQTDDESALHGNQDGAQTDGQERRQVAPAIAPEHPQ
jgi:hypothetical protein